MRCSIVRVPHIPLKTSENSPRGGPTRALRREHASQASTESSSNAANEVLPQDTKLSKYPLRTSKNSNSGADDADRSASASTTAADGMQAALPDVGCMFATGTISIYCPVGIWRSRNRCINIKFVLYCKDTRFTREDER